MQWKTKSLYISLMVSSFYGTEIEIWVGFGPVGNFEKKKGTFQKGHIPKTAYSKNSTFQRGHIPKIAFSEKNVT